MVGGVGAPFGFDRTWGFPVPPELLWSVLHRTDRYPTWWSWLRELDTDGFETGSTARCVIQSPLPYALQCTIHVEEMRPPEAIVTNVTGDLRGPARLEISARAGRMQRAAGLVAHAGQRDAAPARGRRASGDAVGP